MTRDRRSYPHLLATSFTTWKPQQASNTSDDLLALVETSPIAFPPKTLRQLPVQTARAVQAIASAIAQHQPHTVLLCGMAERRKTLSLERYAKQADICLETAIDLDALIPHLPNTQISHDAGSFVCNATYYQLLRQLDRQAVSTRALFVHVPILTAANRAGLLSDFCTLLELLSPGESS
ncbi:hypothetical protein [Synechococcus sp. PCC 7336]|uniref:pyroglutamyl-peptidase I family protein n=1 Tax=Synechococcus sp. PCC 7336 TaxID=195250 RepID=UPI0003485412|nr:hypothetical protein [Synechococcus sp. PCC 7336]